MSSLWIGTAGVGILLGAFVLNLLKIVSERSSLYLLLNVLGSFMAGWYAWADRVIPFVVLELVWGFVALFRLVSLPRKNPRTGGG